MPRDLDTYEEDLRRKATPSGLGAVFFLVFVVALSIVSSAAEWAFWSGVFR